MNTSPFESKPTTSKPVFKFNNWVFGKGRPNLRELLLEAMKNRRIRLGSPGVFTGHADTLPENPMYGYGKSFGVDSVRMT